jgi:anti-sigma regulatory factor (Ser/Thr protein kinase)
MPAYQIQFLFARRPRLVAVARNRVSAQVRSWGHLQDQDVKGTVDLLVSELVTNAVLHATGVMVAVWVRLDGQLLRVEVEDDFPTPPPWPADGLLAGWDDEHGRGLQLVTALASDHGWKPTARGKRVWFEFVLPKPPRVLARASVARRAYRAARRTAPGAVPARPAWTRPARSLAS